MFDRVTHFGKLRLRDTQVTARWPAKVCRKCKRSFRHVRLGQFICNCCAPAPPNRPIVYRATEGDDGGTDAG